LKLQLTSEKDKLAMLQVLKWEDAEKEPLPAQLIATIGNYHVPADQDFEVIIAKSMIPRSYGYNPSLFAHNVLSRMEGFTDSAGAECPDTKFIKVIFYRQEKPMVKYSTKVSIKQRIRDWLKTEELFLDIDVKDITPAYKTRPEQLTYQIRRETETKIKIRRLKTKWVITRA
jgi:hypothetical protein